MIIRRQRHLAEFMKVSKILFAVTLMGALSITPRSIADEMFINPGPGGSWYQPTHDLQGFTLEIVPTANQWLVDTLCWISFVPRAAD